MKEPPEALPKQVKEHLTENHNKYEASYAAADYDSLESENSLREYLHILRERFWWFLAVLLLIFIATVLYTVNRTELYRSSVRVHVLRQKDTTTGFKDLVAYTTILNTEDFRTQVDIIESINIVTRVFNRLNDEERRLLMQPYEGKFSIFGARSPVDVLHSNRKIYPSRGSLVVTISYTHPDKQIAAKIANLFADEYINYNMELVTEATQRAIEELREQIDAESQKIADIQAEIATFQRENDTVSVDPDTNIDQRELLHLNEAVTQDKRVLDELKTRWQQVETYQKEGYPLSDLEFIAIAPQVNQLLAQRSSYKVSMATLGERYREKHPKMIEVKQALVQVEVELQRAVNSATGKIYTNFLRAQENYDNSLQRLAEKKQQIIDLQSLRVDYMKIKGNLDRARAIREYFKQRVMQLITDSKDPREAARVIDRAYPALRPYVPNIPFNLLIGLLFGIGAGIGMAFLVAFLDDRIKTAFDIETFLGLPIIGVLPRLRISDKSRKAQIVTDGGDRHTIESFRSIHSILKLGESGRKNQCLLTTSTVPSEGKSFVCTNLALTYASSGERTIIVDCDLRMPNIARSLKINPKRGLRDYFDHDLAIDRIIEKNVYPNLDIISTGGRIKNSSNLLNSKRFTSLIDYLRTHYDKVLIDTAPLAPVSDALNILPFVDGILYIIKFNAVRRRVIKGHVKRIQDVDTPIFAILNNINFGQAYYYPHYYDGNYDNYYIDIKDTKEAEIQAAS